MPLSFSDFPTLNTFISTGFGACPLVPSWPGSFRRVLVFFLSNSSKFPVALVPRCLIRGFRLVSFL